MHKKGNILTHPTEATRGSLHKFAPLQKRPTRAGMWVALVALTVLIATAAFANQLFAQSDRGTIPQLSLTSDAPGELTISWSMPSETPSDYRISWAPSRRGLPQLERRQHHHQGKFVPHRLVHIPDLHRPHRGRDLQGQDEGPLQRGPVCEQPLERPVGQHHRDSVDHARADTCARTYEHPHSRTN